MGPVPYPSPAREFQNAVMVGMLVYGAFLGLRHLARLLWDDWQAWRARRRQARDDADGRTG